MTDVFARLKEALVRLAERAQPGAELESEVEERLLQVRTERIARQPQHVERGADVMACMVFERSGHRYAARIEALEDVSPMGSIVPVPGTPPMFLGVTARRGRIVAVLDLPRLFGATPPRTAAERAPDRPGWLILVSHPTAVCGIAADAVHDIIETSPEAMSTTMPTFPALIQRHLHGVVHDGTVVLDLPGLLGEPSLLIEERAG